MGNIYRLLRWGLSFLYFYLIYSTYRNEISFSNGTRHLTSYGSILVVIILPRIGGAIGGSIEDK